MNTVALDFIPMCVALAYINTPTRVISATRSLVSFLFTGPLGQAHCPRKSLASPRSSLFHSCLKVMIPAA